MKWYRGLLSALVVGALAVGAAACSSSSKSSSSSGSSSASSSSLASGGPATQASKTAFCNDNIQIDTAAATAGQGNDPAAIVAALKQEQPVINRIESELPADSGLTSQVHTLVSGANAAIASNKPDQLETPEFQSAGGAVDTYCGVDSNGNPLPANFAQGKGSDLCNANASIEQGLQAATSPQDSLTFFKQHQDLVNAFSAAIAKAPADVQKDATTMLNAEKAAVAANDPSQVFTSHDVQTASQALDLYCGVNG